MGGCFPFDLVLGGPVMGRGRVLSLYYITGAELRHCTALYLPSRHPHLLSMTVWVPLDLMGADGEEGAAARGACPPPLGRFRARDGAGVCDFSDGGWWVHDIIPCMACHDSKRGEPPVGRLDTKAAPLGSLNSPPSRAT